MDKGSLNLAQHQNQRLLKTQAHFNSKAPKASLFSHNHGPKEASQELERTEAQQWIKIIFESSPKSINKSLAEYQ